MSEQNLLILITRIEGKNEWAEVWKFPTDDFIAFVRQGKATPHGFEEFRGLDLNAYLDADVWIINGYGYEGDRRELLHASLNEIDWKTHKVILKIHRGGAQFVDSQDFKDEVETIEYPNTKALLKQAQNYSIGNQNAPDHPFVKFASGLRENISDSEYQERLTAITAQTFLYMRMANTIHHLSYVLHPLDIDFQGLQETNFQLDYWKEVIEDCKKGKALERLEQVRHLIYSQAAGADETAESVMIAAEQVLGPGAWTSPWEELKKDFPCTQGPENIEAILTALDAESIAKVQSYFAEDKNPIHDWVTKINKSLGEIRDALFNRERGPEN